LFFYLPDGIRHVGLVCPTIRGVNSQELKNLVSFLEHGAYSRSKERFWVRRRDRRLPWIAELGKLALDLSKFWLQTAFDIVQLSFFFSQVQKIFFDFFLKNGKIFEKIVKKENFFYDKLNHVAPKRPHLSLWENIFFISS